MNEQIILNGKIPDDFVKNNLLFIDKTIEKYYEKIKKDSVWLNSVENYKNILNNSYNTDKYGFYMTNFLDNDYFDNIRFNHICELNNENKFENHCLTIKTFINEHIFLPFGYGPKDHKSICLIEFENKIPDIFKAIVDINEIKNVKMISLVLSNKG